MLNFLGYAFGLALHVLFKAGNWVAARPENKFHAYWGAYAGLNISSAVAAIIFFPLWDMGLITGAMTAAYGSALGMIGVTGTTGRELPISPLTSVMAGFLFDSVARTIVLTIQKVVERRAAKRLLDVPPTGEGGDQ